MAAGLRSSDVTMRAITASGTASWRSLNNLRAMAASKSSSGAQSGKASSAEKRDARSGSDVFHATGDSRPVSNTGAAVCACSSRANSAASRAGLTCAESTSSTMSGRAGSRPNPPLNSFADTDCAPERVCQMAARWDLPEPDGPCRAAAATGHCGQVSMKASAGALASDGTKSSRVRATREPSGRGSCRGKIRPGGANASRRAARFARSQGRIRA